MKKSEKVALSVVVALIVAGIPGWVIANTIQERYANKEYDQLIEESGKTYRMGEAMYLNAEEDMADTTGELSYAAEFPWTGTLKITVKNVALYDSPASVGINNEETGFDAKPDDLNHSDAAFILCEIVISNIDASPLNSTSGGENWFNVTFLNLSPYFPLCYFDGTPNEAIDHDGWCFDLLQGEEKTFLLGYLCPNETQSLATLEQVLQNQSLMLCAGTSSNVSNSKYCCQLKIEDKRSDEWRQNLPPTPEYTD